MTAADYFELLRAAFDATAAAHGGPLRFSYQITHWRLGLQVANQALAAQIVPALVHLSESAETSSDLEIFVWDETSAATAMPSPPWSWQNYMTRGEIGGYESEGFRLWFHVASGVFSILDMHHDRAMVWIRDARRLPIYVTAAPLRMILQAWLSPKGTHFGHAAAVGNDAGAVLLAGPGGSGKSTTALRCLEAGMTFLSDDYCLFSVDPEPLVHSIYCSAKLDKNMVARLAGLSSAIEPRDYPGEDKVLLMLGDRFSDQLARTLPIRALLIPRVARTSATSSRKVSTLEGIRALAPSTMEQIAGPDVSAWRAITSLASRVPCYRFDMGSDLNLIPPAIEALLGGQL